MAKKDNLSTIKTVIALTPRAIATDTTTVGAIIDLRGYNSATITIASGVLTDGAYVPLLEHGDASDLSDAAAVADAYLLPSGTGQEAAIDFALTDDATIVKIGYVGSKRYIRLSIVSTATTTGGLFAAVAILGDPDIQPVA